MNKQKPVNRWFEKSSNGLVEFVEFEDGTVIYQCWDNIYQCFYWKELEMNNE